MKVRAALAILLVASTVAAAAPALASELERIPLPSGDILRTHGPDARSHLGGPVRISAPVAPDCVSEPTPHFRALYGLPLGAPNRSLQARLQIFNSLTHAGGMLQDSTAAGHRVRMRFLCSGGIPRVDTFRGAFEGTSFQLAVAAAQAAGYLKPHVRYVIYWDGEHPFACGQAEIRGDSSRRLENANNTVTSPRYAVNYRGCWSGRVALHEMSHNMGAVQRDAPHSTGAWHCWDGADVMCYADGGPTDEQAIICRAREYDCRDDDYFSDGRPRGYLADHWDLAWSANRFLNVR